ncbi:MAG TPA: MFS transporter [Cellulomonas sp.]
MSRLVETLVPGRLGTPFRWLLASSWVSNLGDGIALAAGPLLVASLTDDARLVALAATLQWLPPLLLGLLAGALADRWDRRRIIVVVDVLRALVLTVLVATIATDRVTIGVALVTLFVLGTAEVFADGSSQTLLPMLVSRRDLTVANARLQTGFITVNQLAGPPIGAALFAAGSLWPFASEAVVVALAAVLVTRIALPAHPRDPEQRPHLWQDIAEGFRWTVHHAAVRTLVLTIFTFNITFGAAWSVLVLYATRRLGMGEVGYGLLTTVSAVGGLAATGAYGWITRRVNLGNLMRIGLVLETLTHLGLALTTRPWVAMAIFFVFGAHAFVWGTTSVTVRQRAVPQALQGRVGSVNTVGVFGGLVVGSTIGGTLAERWGVTAPFWFAFVGSAVFVVLIWRQLRHIAHDDDAEDGAEEGTQDEEAEAPEAGRARSAPRVRHDGAVPLEIRPLGPDDGPDARAGHAELAAEGFTFLPFFQPDEAWADYLARIVPLSRGDGLPSDLVPWTDLYGVQDGVVIGRVSVRHRLSAGLARTGGQIGYGVRPGWRRRGYATALLRAGLDVAAGLGVEQALVTCDDDNAGSAAVIERSGGVLQDVVADPDGGAPKRRYRVPTR